jgi:alpha/beta superfamily hydrolase
MKTTIIAVAAALLLGAGNALADDPVREARIASQIEDAILDGEPVWLQAGQARFLAIYTRAATPETRGAAVILHGSDAHPDWPDVVFPLRTQLPEHGWATLSIQLPVTAPGAPAGSWQADLPLAAPRIAAAAAWLKKRQFPYLALIGHSLGARMGAEYLGGLHGAPDPAFRAFVAVGLTANPADTDRGVLLALKQLQLPMLDLYGERDFGGVIHSADARRRAALQGRSPAYSQVQAPGADHFFRGLDGLLVSRVRAWLAKTAGDAAAE